MKKVKGCRNTIAILIGSLCAVWMGFAIFYPQLAEWYGQLADRRVCSNLPEDTEIFVQDPLPEISVEFPITPITIKNVSQLVPITDVKPLEHFQLPCVP